MEPRGRTDADDAQEEEGEDGATAARALRTPVPPTESRMTRFSPILSARTPLGYCERPYAIHIPERAIPIWVFETAKSAVMNGTTGLTATRAK